MDSATGYLTIYMNDQLALGVGWRELARRAAGATRGSEAGVALERVATAIAEDVETFAQLMDRLGLPKSRVKPGLATVAERLGRLKLNGHLLTTSPLSRFIELDTLIMGLEGKRILWATLRDHAGLGARLPDVDFGALIARAEEQHALLEPHHAAAGAAAFGGVPQSAGAGAAA